MNICYDSNVNQNKNTFPVVIVSGGLGTRLYPLTKAIPKSLVQINGEPFIAHQLRYLKSQNVSHVVFCLGYLGNMVKDFLSQPEWNDLKIEYSFDGEKLLGTAGAIKKALSYLPESFFILYGDSYLPCDFYSVQNAYLNAHEHMKKNALMTVFKNEGQWDKSNVVFCDGQIIDYHKQSCSPQMNYIDYGLGVFNKKAFDFIADDQPYDLAVLYRTLLINNQLTAYEVKERFYEVGSFFGIDELNKFFSSRDCRPAQACPVA